MSMQCQLACRSSRGTLSVLRQLPTRPLKFFRCSSARARDNKATSKPIIMKLTVHSYVRCLLSEKAHRYLNISRRFEATLPFYLLYKASNEKTRVPARVFLSLLSPTIRPTLCICNVRCKILATRCVQHDLYYLEKIQD